MKEPNCFISYSWDMEEHKAWVRNLAIELYNKGVRIYLDQWDCGPGTDLTTYMETCIREVNYVLLICTPDFADKANTARGGVGYEKIIVTGEIFSGLSSQEKFIPIIRTGNPKNSLPSYLKSKYFIDFRNDDEFDEKLEELLRHLYRIPKYVPPALGPKPDFADKKDMQPKINVGTKKIIFPLYAQVYKFAYSPIGMNKSREGAEEFTKHWFDKYLDRDFEKFKEIYLFACNTSGMDKSYQGAEEFVNLWFERFYNKNFEIFKEVYNFAYSPEGMNKSRKGAEEFALGLMINN